MKICMIGTVASSTLNFRKTFIELLVNEGHEVYVFATDYTPRTESAISDLGATPVHYSFNRGGLNPFSDILDTFNLRKKIKKIMPDIVFSYFSKPVIYGTLAARMASVPRIIGMLEGLGYAFTPAPPQQKYKIKKIIIKTLQIYLYKISFRYLDRIIFLNSNDTNDLIRDYKIKVKDIKILGGIGVDLEKFKKTPPPLNPIRFLFIGRLLKEKGIIEFLKSAEIVKKKYPDVEFIVLGEIDKCNPSSLSKDDLDYYKKLSIINHPGHVENVQEWIEKCSVFVLPSYREGLPCSTQEAMACGRAIISTNCAGCLDTVVENLNGFIIPIYSIDLLAEKIIYFITNKQKIVDYGSQSRILAEKKFDSKKQNKMLKNLLDI